MALTATTGALGETFGGLEPGTTSEFLESAISQHTERLCENTESGSCFQEGLLRVRIRVHNEVSRPIKI